VLGQSGGLRPTPGPISAHALSSSPANSCTHQGMTDIQTPPPFISGQHSPTSLTMHPEGEECRVMTGPSTHCTVL